MEQKEIKQLRSINTESLAIEIGYLMRKELNTSDVYYQSLAFGTALYFKRKFELNVFDEDECLKVLGKDWKDILIFINEQLSGLESLVNDFRFKHSNEELLSFILFDSTMSERGDSTPESICKLANEILGINDSDVVYDLCSGIGNFLIESALRNHNARYYGIELNFNEINVSKLKFLLLKLNCEFQLNDVIESSILADKIFSNPPIKMNGINKLHIFSKMEELGIPYKIIDRSSSDWIINSIILSSLKEGGKGVSVISVGSTWNMNDSNIRQKFIENGFIEAVITLPEGLFKPYSGICTALIVLSKNNEYIRMIDARKLYEKSFRRNIISDKQIDVIMESFNKDNEISVRVPISEFKHFNYELDPVKHLVSFPKFDDGIKFGKIIQKITRGSQIKAVELDKYKSDTVTNIQYLMLSNIEKGIVHFENNQCLKELPENTEKYCIKDKAIVLSKTSGSDFKSALVEVPSDLTLLANGNMFVIDINPKYADPYYIQAFLQSPTGQLLLKSISAGAAIQTIPVKSLKEMIIPLPSMDKQQDIALKYIYMLDEIKLLRKRLDRKYKQMEYIFEED